MPLRPQPVTEFLRTRDYVDRAFVLDLSDPLKIVADDADLCIKLRGVGHLLKIASAAPADVRARRIDPKGRWCNDSFDLRKSDLALYLINPNAEFIRDHSKHDENG